MPNLGTRFLDGQPLDAPLQAFHSPVQAIDAYVVGDKHLMIVMEDGVRVAEISSVGPAKILVNRLATCSTPNRGAMHRRYRGLVSTQWIPAA